MFEGPPDYNSAANEIGEVGTAPKEVKLVAAKMLLNCGLRAGDRHIFFKWEAPAGAAPYTLELSHEQFQNESITRCLHEQAKALGAEQQIDLGEEAPPPPSGQKKSA